MFIGHFAVALGAKKASPKTSLGTLFVAAQLVDLLWPLFLLLGLEHVRIDPGNTAVTPLDFYDYPITHSLLGAVGWSIAFAFFFYLLRKDRHQSLIVSGVVLSHWILDAVTHRPDLPLFPGSSTYLGLGLWNSVAATMIVELSLFAAGVILYVRSTVATDRTGTFAFWGLVAFLIVVWAINIFGPPPPDESSLAIAANATWLIVLWGYWIDRHRKPANTLSA